MKFEVDRLHTIHKKYLQEGKITIDFLEKRDRITLKGVDVVSVDELQDIITQIIVNDASKENLQLLINKLIALRKVVKQPDSKRESSATVSNERPLKRKSKVHDDDDKCPALTRK